MIILITWGGQNEVKLDYVICARSLTLRRVTLEFQAIAFLQVLLDSK